MRLRVSDIDAGRDMLRVEQGKGRKDRYTLLAAPLRRVTPLLAGVPPHAAVAVSAADQGPAEGYVDRPEDLLCRQGAGGHSKVGGSHALRHAFTPTYWQGARISPRGNACWATRVSRPPCPMSTSRGATWPRKAHHWRAYQPSGAWGNACRRGRRLRPRPGSQALRSCPRLKSPLLSGRMARHCGPRIPCRMSKRASYGPSLSVGPRRWVAMSNTG